MIWFVLESYDSATDELAAEHRLDHLIEPEHLVHLVGASSVDDLIEGGWHVSSAAAEQIGSALQLQLDMVRQEHFVAAVQAPDPESLPDESAFARHRK